MPAKRIRCEYVGYDQTYTIASDEELVEVIASGGGVYFIIAEVLYEATNFGKDPKDV